MFCGRREPTCQEIGNVSTTGHGSRSALCGAVWWKAITNWINCAVNEPLQITLADVVEFLSSNRVAYALIGGLAVSLRGQPRVTMDVDIVVAVEMERALELISSLQSSKFRPLFDDVGEVVARSFILPLRHRTTNVKVDLSIGLSGFERQAVARAEVRQLAGIAVRVATTEDLMIMKVLAGRPQDDQDLRGLMVAQDEYIDWEYCQQTASDLGEAIGVDLAGRIRALRFNPPFDS